MGPAEELTIDELRDQFETNLFGILRLDAEMERGILDETVALSV